MTDYTYTETRDGDYIIRTYSDGATVTSLNPLDIPDVSNIPFGDDEPSLKEIQENQIALMSAIADLYIKLMEVSL